MNDLLTVDQVACLFNLVEHLSDIKVPLIKCLVCVLLGLSCTLNSSLFEDDNSLHAVDLGSDTCLLDDHVAQLSFREITGDSDKLSEPIESDA